jgi:hypothetical protein
MVFVDRPMEQPHLLLQQPIFVQLDQLVQFLEQVHGLGLVAEVMAGQLQVVVQTNQLTVYAGHQKMESTQ